MKFIVRNILKMIDSIIDFINYITGLELSHIPTFSDNMIIMLQELENKG